MAATARTVTRDGNIAAARLSSKVVFVKKFRGDKNFEAKGLDGVADSLKIRIYDRVWSRIFRMSSQLQMEKAVS